MASRCYYGSKITEHLVKLDNGCLLCVDVPIARTGTYKYLREELGLDGSGIVEVYREPEEVFSNKTLASFNGMAFTDTHPAEDVTSDNWGMYAKGEITNAHQGAGVNDIYLMVDILVRDPIVINEIISGAKREISAGYDCDYIEKDGKIYQTNIRGNHAALVQCGRAGNKVRINDDADKIKNNKYKFVKALSKAIKNVK